jgi:hypothetical protein
LFSAGLLLDEFLLLLLLLLPTTAFLYELDLFFYLFSLLIYYFLPLCWFICGKFGGFECYVFDGFSDPWPLWFTELYAFGKFFGPFFTSLLF